MGIWGGGEVAETCSWFSIEEQSHHFLPISPQPTNQTTKNKKPHYKLSIISIPTLDHVSRSGLGGGGEDGKGREQREKESTITFKAQNLSYKQFTRHYKYVSDPIIAHINKWKV